MTALPPDRGIKGWLAAFDDALSRGDVDRTAELFLPDAFWRDFVAFTWNLHTAEGQEAIRDMLDACLRRTAPASWQLAGPVQQNDDNIEAMATFETAAARCHAVVRLKNGKCRMLFTAMTELKGFEETCGARRPVGHPLQYQPGRKSWRRQREQDAKELGITRQPYCVIIGAGHSGLSLGARLKQLNVPTLIIDKSARPSDTWRNRHESLSLHSPVWFDQMPYFPYPETWPLHASKDQFADWLDAYRTLMDLDLWTETECLSADFDEARCEWRLDVRRNGRALTLHPKQLVFANGLFGKPKLPDIPGMYKFKGELRHASAPRASDDYTGRRCVVIGSGTTAHDICAELWEAGGDVTMIQRSPTIVMRLESLIPAFARLYGDEAKARGMTTEMADLLSASMPLRVQVQMHRELVAQVKEQEAPFYEGLRKAGFLLTFGKDEAGIFPQVLRDPSGYYIDVGASALIMNGSIKLRSGVGVEALGEEAMLLSDGSELPADVIIYATGYELATVARILPEEMARKVGRVWGFGSGIGNDPGPWEGELRNMWKPTRQTGLWFHTQGIGGVRFPSLILALQIKAREAGIPTHVYKLADVHHAE
ncbi:MAG TPA: NAD(P)/FAD-dependent oxidoreductase [Acetobacteraceae bacterium]|nr:NAD(P)/FAD-dependent oxidoreductase [Acetobacteraceae bacterium]